MLFKVDESVFNRLPNAIFGVVTAYNTDNTRFANEIAELLANQVTILQSALSGQRIKDYAAILPYREAFQSLGINPNKFMPSIEALMTRVQKSGSLPSINPLVDLINTVSLRHQVPMGAHDLDTTDGVIMIRPSGEQDSFIPFGQSEEEKADIGELVYISDHKIRTRRWIWRQSEIGKVTASTRNIFVPVDGFANYNAAAVQQAVDEAALLLQHYFNCSVYSGLVDRDHPIFDDGQA